MAAEIDADVLAQLHRIHVAANDGTFDKEAINDALRKLHDFLSGVAYEEAGGVVEGDDAAMGEAGVSSHRKVRKKR